MKGALATAVSKYLAQLEINEEKEKEASDAAVVHVEPEKEAS